MTVAHADIRPFIMTLRDADLPACHRVADVIAAVSACTGISVKDITGPYRAKHVLPVRFAAYWLARRLTDKSYLVIARCFNRDHATVLHGVKVVDRYHEPFARIIADTMAFLKEPA